MNHCGTQKLETGRLILRRLTMRDADAMFRNWASDPEVTRFLTWPAHTDAEVTKHIIGTWLPLYEKNDYYHWAIILKENGDEPIGTIHGLVNDDLQQVTVGYCLGRAWWHQGIMSEALQAVIDFFFEQVRPNSICSYHDPNNPHSGMVMKHCGMKYEGTRRASDRNNTGICDISWYSILPAEHRLLKSIPGRKAMLELRRLSVDDGPEVFRMLQEIPKEENGFGNNANGMSYGEYREWLAAKHQESLRDGILDGWKVPTTTYWLYADGIPVGFGKLRHCLTDALRKAGGHIGYAIAPAYRGKGYGKELLRLLLQKANEMGMEKVLLTVRLNNRASQAVAFANGGIVTGRTDERVLIWIDT